MKTDLREAYFWATEAKNNASIRPSGELTLEKVSKLTKIFRDRLPNETASKGGIAATRLTDKPI